MRRRSRGDRGQSLLEVAILTPFLLGLAVGIIDAGRLYRFNTIVGSSARAGAQYGAQNLTTALDVAGMTLAAKNDAQQLAGLTVSATNLCKCADGTTVSCTSTACSSSHRLLYVSVTSSYTFTTLFDYHVIPTAIPLSRTVTMQDYQ